MKDTRAWMNEVFASHPHCDNYAKKMRMRESKKSLYDFLLDINVCEFFVKRNDKRDRAFYRMLCEDFRNFINGEYVVENDGYSREMYVEYGKKGEVEARTNLLILLGCKDMTIKIRENDFVRIYVDSNCEINISCPRSSRVLVEYYGTPTITPVGIVGDRIEYNEMKE